VREDTVAQGSPTISTHVLDLESGVPAEDLDVALFRLTDDGVPELLSEHQTDADGRVLRLLAEPLSTGDYQLLFDLASYDPDAFIQSVALALRIDDASRSYHVPLLLSPFGLTTYRGS
jgi:5-hydroxyisourate hydrolase